MDRDDLISTFCSCTGQEPSVARDWLDQHSWQIEDALNSFFAMDHTISPSASAAAASTPISTSIGAAASSSSSRNNQVPSKPIHEEDFSYTKKEKLVTGVSFLSKQNLSGSILQEQTVIQDPFRNFQSEQNGTEDAFGNLFAPPKELLFQGSLRDAQAVAEAKTVWLLVNLQSHSCFDAHRLNRDTWSDPQLKDLIRLSFVFWQPYVETDIGKEYHVLYPSSSLPQIDILDPATGARVFHMEGFKEASDLIDTLMTFVQDHDWGTAKPISFKGSEPKISSSFVDVNDDNDNGKLKKTRSSSSSRSLKKNSSLSSQNAMKFSADSSLRQQQDEEYMEAMLKDQEKQRQLDEDQALEEALRISEQEAIENMLLQQQQQQHISSPKKQKSVVLADEPSSDDPNCTTMAFRMVDGSRQSRRFSKQHLVHHLYDYLEYLGMTSANYRLISPHPRTILERDMDVTLESLHLFPQALLIVEKISE